MTDWDTAFEREGSVLTHVKDERRFDRDRRPKQARSELRAQHVCLSFKGVVAIPIAPIAWAGVSVVWDDTAVTPAAARFLAVLREVRAAVGSRS